MACKHMSTNGTMFPHCDVKGEHDDKPWDLEVLYLQTNQKNRPNLQVQHEQFSRGYSIGSSTIGYQKYWIYVTNTTVFSGWENQRGTAWNYAQ